MDDLIEQLSKMKIKEMNPELLIYQIYEWIIDNSKNICSNFYTRRPMIQKSVWVNFPESFMALHHHSSPQLRLLLGKIANCGYVDFRGRLVITDQLKLDQIYNEIQMMN
jgi:hypothetical protein